MNRPSCVMWMVAWSALLITIGVAAAQPSQSPPTAAPATAPSGGQLDQLVRPGDRLLFIGDDLTQQMMFTRGVAAALLALRPKDNLRFFNGGRDGATVASARKDFDDLAALAKPTVVFICLGHHDGQGKSGDDAKPLLQAFARDLEAFTRQVQAKPGVHHVILIAPPAVQAGLTDPISPLDFNATLFAISSIVPQVATRCGAGFVDLFDPMRRVYLSQEKLGGEPLSYGGRLPTEVGNVIVASHVLAGIGVTAAMIEPTGWSPVVPREMGRVRRILAWETKISPLEMAQRSRDVYLCIQKFDEAFFKQWRLAGKRFSSPSKESTAAASEDAWNGVREAMNDYWSPVTGGDKRR